jgi:Fe-S-cluster containining protein
MYYLNHPLRFECTGCGQCCTGSGEYYVEVTPVEQDHIRRHLGLSRAWFRRRYLLRFDDGVESLRMSGRPVKRCVFLGAENRCGIYAVRPAQCRHYPIWPELVNRASAWRLEARRCEGIGRGDVIPLARIRGLLRKQSAR